MKPLGWFLPACRCCPNHMTPGTATAIFSLKPVSSQAPCFHYCHFHFLLPGPEAILTSLNH